MPNEHDNAQPMEQQGNPQPADRPGDDRPMPGQKPQNPGERDDDMGRKQGHGGDEGKVGQDTDGDGKTVKPGQKPGQSGGKGLPENQ